ncbi:MAG TPA: cytochrome c/FTR1 family iron permease [Gemmatimonadales bacterium]|nr:cytochrome c/FTR1 family iron permease [Gemmatimonadales bacterium]
MKMVLIGGAVLLGATLLTQQPSPPQEPAPLVRRLAATAQLAAQEYRVGIVDGRVVSPAEVDEARLFLQESRRSAAALPPAFRSAAMAGIDSVIKLVNRTASPDSIDARVRRLTSGLSTGLGVPLDVIPTETPSLARGAEVFQANCAGCHGTLGRGDGPAARGLEPKPTNLADGAALKDQSPLDYYRRISIGVVGTAMPAFELRLPAQDRWAAALYATLLRLPPPSGQVPPDLEAFATTGKMSDTELIRALGAHDTAAAALAQVAAIRSAQPDATAGAAAHVFDQVRAQLESTYTLARKGDTSANTSAFDAYMTFEQVERGVRAKNPALAAELEGEFAALRAQVVGRGIAADLERTQQRLATGLEKAERTLADTLSPANLFFQSFVIMLREGLEAILVVGALMTFLVKMGASHRKRDINLGVGAAILASLATAFAIETVFHLTAANQEVLEGVTMVVATVVLFYVSYWLLSKMEVAKWNHFVRSKVNDALTSGSSLALASAAFLAVYREGFETVLFYKALFLTGGPGSSGMPVLAGILVGAVVLLGVYIAISRFGVRLPLKPFFGVTSAFLYYMAFVFAGKGVAELQSGGVISTTLISWAPRAPALGIYPTVESLLAQGVLVILLLAALIWTFFIEPRRPASSKPALPVSPTKARPPASLEADLTEAAEPSVPRQ